MLMSKNAEDKIVKQIIKDYSNTWSFLSKYDDNKLTQKDVLLIIKGCNQITEKIINSLKNK
jgi:hypothetical protein